MTSISAPARLATFAGVIAAVFGGAALVGGATGASPPNDKPAKAEHRTGEMAMKTGHAEMSAEPAGLAIAEGGFRVAVSDPTFRAAHRQELRFRVLDRAGRPVRNFEEEHGARLHLILARRDLTGYQHLHPRLGRDGTWSVPVTFAEPGAYRMYADFHIGGRGLTLGADLFVPGDFQPRALPAETNEARVGGYTVALREDAPGELRFGVSRGGREVTDLQPYLGARGHLVALREGDLAYLHVHPEEGPEPGAGVSFHAEYPSAAKYRLFLQFKHRGRVHTAEFTREVTR
jgi:hypothetical protein